MQIIKVTTSPPLLHCRPPHCHFVTVPPFLTQANNGVPPTTLELFDHTHKKRSSGDGTPLASREYATTTCGDMMSTYSLRITEKYGDDPSNHPILHQELWEEAVGGNKKVRVVGFGNNKDVNRLLTGISTTSGSSSSDPREVQALKDEISDMKEENLRRDKQIEEMAALVKKLSDSQHGPLQPPPE